MVLSIFRHILHERLVLSKNIANSSDIQHELVEFLSKCQGIRVERLGKQHLMIIWGRTFVSQG